MKNYTVQKLAAVFFCLTLALAYTQADTLQLWWLGLGVCVGLSLAVISTAFWEKEQKVPAPAPLPENPQKKATIEALQLKLQEAQEKIEAHKKQTEKLQGELKLLKLQGKEPVLTSDQNLI